MVLKIKEMDVPSLDILTIGNSRIDIFSCFVGLKIGKYKLSTAEVTQLTCISISNFIHRKGWLTSYHIKLCLVLEHIFYKDNCKITIVLIFYSSKNKIAAYILRVHPYDSTKKEQFW